MKQVTHLFFDISIQQDLQIVIKFSSKSLVCNFFKRKNFIQGLAMYFYSKKTNTAAETNTKLSNLTDQ